MVDVDLEGEGSAPDDVGGRDDAGHDVVEQEGPGLFEDADAASLAPTAPGAAGSPAPGAPDSPRSGDSTVPVPPAALAPDDSPDGPLALYRRYRPDTFEQVIGQEHVTIPLQRAIANNRVNHAYLFSGPRGCGKTTSARILARCLNCEEGPTPTPCGHCRSCRELATGGSGSIDVIEIDAASHGRVDDARELREGVYFAPAYARFKVYIIDEAHMVTKEGFNALLKVVEEPPPHVKFIFATTEPDKVIGTIRSRTHHYPFRLVPPKLLGGYLDDICQREHARVEPGVLPLVVRAGAGSVRDSMSVLDQLLGAAGDNGVSYAQATALLGFTPEALLDEMVDAIVAGDAKGVFATIDKVIETGQEPRRFAEDLLQRLRDLVIVAQVPDAISSGLIDAPADQAERFEHQAAGLGAGELTRAAEVIATGLTQMRGTTAPRLHLELMCARVLLPGADGGDRGVHARLDRLERRIGVVGQALGAGAEAVVRQPEPARPDHARSGPVEPAPDAGAAVHRGGRTERSESRRPAASTSSGRGPSAAPGPMAAQVCPPADPAEPAASQNSSPHGAPQPGPVSGLGTPEVRRLWPEVLMAVKSRRRFAWILLSQNAQVLDAGADGLTLAFNSAGARDSFHSSGSADVLRDCLVEVMGADLPVRSVVEGAAVVGQGRGESVPHQRPAASTRGERPASDHRAQQPSGHPGAAVQESVQEGQRAAPGAHRPAAQALGSPVQKQPEAPPQSRPAAARPTGGGGRHGHSPTGPAGGSGQYPGWSQEPPPDPQDDGGASAVVDPGDLPSMDDASVDESGQSAAQLLMDQLDAEIISEEDLD